MTTTSPDVWETNEELRDRAALILTDVRTEILGLDLGLEVHVDDHRGPYLQVYCERPDTFTGHREVGYGGPGWLTKGMSEDNIVQLGFGLIRAYLEHEAREGYLWRGRRVYGPHMLLRALWEAAGEGTAPVAQSPAAGS